MAEERGWRIGDRVETTPLYLRNGVGRRHCRGVVVGVDLTSRYVRVRIDGRKSASTYASAFWQKSESPV